MFTVVDGFRMHGGNDGANDGPKDHDSQNQDQDKQNEEQNHDNHDIPMIDAHDGVDQNHDNQAIPMIDAHEQVVPDLGLLWPEGNGWNPGQELEVTDQQQAQMVAAALQQEVVVQGAALRQQIVVDTQMNSNQADSPIDNLAAAFQQLNMNEGAEKFKEEEKQNDNENKKEKKENANNDNNDISHDNNDVTHHKASLQSLARFFGNPPDNTSTLELPERVVSALSFWGQPESSFYACNLEEIALRCYLSKYLTPKELFLVAAVSKCLRGKFFTASDGEQWHLQGPLKDNCNLTFGAPIGGEKVVITPRQYLQLSLQTRNPTCSDVDRHLLAAHSFGCVLRRVVPHGRWSFRRLPPQVLPPKKEPSLAKIAETITQLMRQTENVENLEERVENIPTEELLALYGTEVLHECKLQVQGGCNLLNMNSH
jgi:hypothetical protein